MRSGVLVVVVAAVAACSSPGGVKFEIDPSADPGVTEVRLYVGTGDGASAAITAEGQVHDPQRAGTFWPLDDVASVDVVKVSAGSALSYTLTPVEGVDLLTVIAVGFTNGTPTSKAAAFQVPVAPEVITIWDLVLKPVADLEPGATNAVQVWGSTSDATTCVQAISPEGPHPIAFIGTAGDQDCDGHLAGTRDECDDEWHNGGTVLTTSTVSCAESVELTIPVNEMVDVCLFGGEQCLDGQPDGRGACSHAKPYCAPSELCDLCSAASDPQERFECALGLVPSMQGAGSVLPATCDLVFDLSLGDPVLCTQRLVLEPPPWAATITCSPSSPRYHSAAAGSGWSSLHAVGGVKFAFEPGMPGACALEIAVAREQGMTVGVGRIKAEHGLIAADLANGRGVVAPLRFDVQTTTSGCDMVGARSQCTAPTPSVDDTIATCLTRAPVIAPGS